MLCPPLWKILDPPLFKGPHLWQFLFLLLSPITPRTPTSAPIPIRHTPLTTPDLHSNTHSMDLFLDKENSAVTTVQEPASAAAMHANSGRSLQGKLRPFFNGIDDAIINRAAAASFLSSDL